MEQLLNVVVTKEFAAVEAVLKTSQLSAYECRFPIQRTTHQLACCLSQACAAPAGLLYARSGHAPMITTCHEF